MPSNTTTYPDLTFPEDLIEKIEKYICVSESVKRDIILKYPKLENKCEVIDNYLDVKEIIEKSDESIQFKIDKRRLNIVTVARIAKDKGFKRMKWLCDAFEKKNASYLGRGVVFSKFTGSRGKSGSNDANAEYLAELRNIMDNANVAYQTAELGKVDIGGGGTIAYILSLYGMQVIDSGVAVLNMHAPWEITSKADVYEAKKCYAAFLKAE